MNETPPRTSLPPRRPPSAPRANDARPAELVERLEAYAERHRSLENYVLAYHLMFRVFRRLGIDPHAPRGRLAMGAWVVSVLVLVPVASSAIAGDLAALPWRVIVGLAFVFGVLGAGFYHPFSVAIDTSLSLQRAMIDPEGVERVVAFDRHWFRMPPAVGFGALFALGMLAILVFSGGLRLGQLATGTHVLASMLLYQVGEIMYSVLVLGLESRILGDYDYELYRLSPLDSLPMRRTLRGSTQLGMLVCFVATAFIAGFAILFHDHGRLAAHATLVLVVLAYVATALGMLFPRLAILRVVRSEKEREMAPIQARLDALVARAIDLDDKEQAELERLRQVHDTIKDASEAVLPIASLGQVVSALLLPTITYVVSQAREEVAGTISRLLGG